MIPLDWIASALTLVSMFLVAHRHPFAGMVLGLVAQVPWGVVAWRTGLYGMLTFEVVAVGIYVYGAWRHRP